MDGTPTTAIGVLEVPQPHARSTSRFYTRVRTCDGFCASTLYLKCGPSYLYNLYIIPIHSMYGIYAYIDPPGTTPTDRHICQSHGVYGLRSPFRTVPVRAGCSVVLSSPEEFLKHEAL